jgi:hypothetical protein
LFYCFIDERLSGKMWTGYATWPWLAGFMAQVVAFEIA